MQAAHPELNSGWAACIWRFREPAYWMTWLWTSLKRQLAVSKAWE
jgi:hypothetical protein